MLGKRSLIALLLSALLSLGTIGVVFADDSGGCDSLPSLDQTDQQIQAGSVWA